MKKQAQGVPNLQFEGSFADLAYTYVKDKAPKLLDYIVGFQVIHKNEDETRAAGQFGFMVGDQWMFVPCFFMNGELKGYDLLYLKDQDIFVPLQENWVNYVISKKAQVLGEASKLQERDTGIGTPDMTQYTESPLKIGLGKTASGEAVGYWRDGNLFDVLAALRPLVTPLDNPREKTAAARLDLPSFLAGNRKAAELFVSTMSKSAGFSEAVLRFYDVADFTSKPIVKSAGTTQEVAQVGAPEEKVEIVIAAPAGNEAADELTDDERRSLIADGFAVRDGRKKTNKLYRKDIGNSFISPAASDKGMFEVFTKDKTLEPAFICGAPVTIGKGSVKGSLVVLTGEKASAPTLFAPKRLFVQQPALEETASYKKFFSSLAPVTSVTAKKYGNPPSSAPEPVTPRANNDRPSYVIVDEAGNATLPFFVYGKEENDGVTTLYVDYTQFWPSSRSGCCAPCSPSQSWESIPDPEVDHANPPADLPTRMSHYEWTQSCRRVTVIAGDVPRMTNVGDTLVVTSACRVIKAKETDTKLQPGDLSDITAIAYRTVKTAELRIFGGHGSFQFKVNGALTPPLRKEAAMRFLLLGHGIGADQAAEALDQAHGRGHAAFIVKYAQDIAAPAFTDPAQYYDDSMRSMVQPATEQQVPIGMPQEQPIGSSDPVEMMNPNDLQSIVQAAKSGDKEVFDTASVTGLVNTLNVPDMIDKYLSDLVIGMDRIGRILFLFYWHNDSFEERYGQEELQELEDTLKDTFRGVGNLVLFMKKKTAEPSIVLSGTDVNLSAV